MSTKSLSQEVISQWFWVINMWSLKDHASFHYLEYMCDFPSIGQIYAFTIGQNRDAPYTAILHWFCGLSIPIIILYTHLNHWFFFQRNDNAYSFPAFFPACQALFVAHRRSFVSLILFSYCSRQWNWSYRYNNNKKNLVSFVVGLRN